MSVHTSYSQGVYSGDLLTFAANRSVAAPATPFDLITDGLFQSLELALWNQLLFTQNKYGICTSVFI